MAVNISSDPNSGEKLLPKRNPGLLRRIADAFVANQPDMGPQPQDLVTTSTGVTQALVTAFEGTFKNDLNRRSIYKDAEEMDQASPEVSVALDTLADNVISSEDGAQMNFVVMAKNPKAQDVFDKVMATCRLHQKIRPLVRNFLKYGDSFSEICANADYEITDFRQLPPITMYRNETLQGQLLAGKPTYDVKTGACTSEPNTCAFEQRAEDSSAMLAAFYEWQIVHIRLNYDGFNPYGRSHLRVSRILYRQLKALEESLIVGRLTRDLLKLVFYVDTTNLSQKQKEVALQNFQQSVTQRVHIDGRRENPFSVMTDFFLSTGWIKLGNQVQPSQTKLDVVDPKNVGLHEVQDIEYLHRKFIVTLRVPPAHLGFEKDVNAKSTLGIQDVQYVRFLRAIQQLVGHGLEQLFDTALILAGLDPENEEYEIIWPRLAAVDILNSAQAEQFQSAADQIYGPTGIGVIDASWIAKHRFNMSDEEIKEVQDRIDEFRKEQSQQEAQNMQDTHNRQVELIKAKASVQGFTKKPDPAKSQSSRYTAHPKGENDAPRKKALNQEVKALVTVMGQEIKTDLKDNLLQLSKDIRENGNGHSESEKLDLFLESMKEMVAKKPELPDMTFHFPEQKAPKVKFEKDSIKVEPHHEVHIDKGAIQAGDTSLNLELTEEAKPVTTKAKYKIIKKEDGTYEVEKG